jgi:hypothetical protein
MHYCNLKKIYAIQSYGHNLFFPEAPNNIGFQEQTPNLAPKLAKITENSGLNIS